MIDAIKKVLLHGVRSVYYNAKFVFLLWAFNAVSALVLTVPIYSIFRDNLGRSLMSERLAIDFDYFWFLQFRNIYQIQLDQIPLTIYFVGGVYTLLQTFFLGGLISVFNTPEKNHTADFFYGGVRYFSRFVKILFITIILFVIAFIVNAYTGDLITWIFKNSENVTADFILKLARYILLIFFIGVVTLISDYSKVSLAVSDRTDVLRGIYNAAIFIKNNFNKVFTVFLIIAIIGALGAVVYNIIGRFIPRTPYYFIILSFILQQMLIIFRLLIRMLFFSTEVFLYKDLSADIIKMDAH